MNDGGPAFGLMGSGVSSNLTVRDFFAAKAMQAMLSNEPNQKLNNGEARGIAAKSYWVAEAMMEVRKPQK